MHEMPKEKQYLYLSELRLRGTMMHQLSKALIAGTAVSALGGAAVMVTQPLGYYLSNYFHNSDLVYLTTTAAGLLVLGIGLTYTARFMRQ